MFATSDHCIKNTWNDNPYDFSYNWLKAERKKNNIQKDWGEFEGARIFSRGLFLSKYWQEIHGY